ncbi:MAG: MoxR family ATPase [Gammaproteobacteria bacterium]|nr:MoxR family ATPase [Gammaproteobacteria bacterium]
MTDIKAVIDTLAARASDVVLGKEHEIRLSLACLLARGHLLIEDLPGVGKTTLAHVLAKILGLEYHRIQFTSDLLPADILGVSIFEKERGDFRFLPGPIFAQLILADEVNRATPKAQSALLEAMEEGQVTIEGETRPLPEPFFVIATQNPTHQIGTFPLPESQLDRFLMRISLGYPNPRAERKLLTGQDRRELLKDLQPCLDSAQLARIQTAVPQVHVADALLDYLQALLHSSRQSSHFSVGLSPRAGLSLLHSAQAWALMAGRDHVLPEDVQTVLPHVVGHRLRGSNGGDEDTNADALIAKLAAVAIP